MSRTNIVLDEPLVEQAMHLSGLKTKRATVNAALLEYVETRTRLNLLDLRGSKLIADDYDYKSARAEQL